MHKLAEAEHSNSPLEVKLGKYNDAVFAAKAIETDIYEEADCRLTYFKLINTKANKIKIQKSVHLPHAVAMNPSDFFLPNQVKVEPLIANPNKSEKVCGE